MEECVKAVELACRDDPFFQGFDNSLNEPRRQQEEHKQEDEPDNQPRIDQSNARNIAQSFPLAAPGAIRRSNDMR